MSRGVLISWTATNSYQSSSLAIQTLYNPSVSRCSTSSWLLALSSTLQLPLGHIASTHSQSQADQADNSLSRDLFALGRGCLSLDSSASVTCELDTRLADGRRANDQADGHLAQ